MSDTNQTTTDSATVSVAPELAAFIKAEAATNTSAAQSATPAEPSAGANGAAAADGNGTDGTASGTTAAATGPDALPETTADAAGPVETAAGVDAGAVAGAVVATPAEASQPTHVDLIMAIEHGVEHAFAELLKRGNEYSGYVVKEAKVAAIKAYHALKGN